MTGWPLTSSAIWAISTSLRRHSAPGRKLSGRRRRTMRHFTSLTARVLALTVVLIRIATPTRMAAIPGRRRRGAAARARSRPTRNSGRVGRTASRDKSACERAVLAQAQVVFDAGQCPRHEGRSAAELRRTPHRGRIADASPSVATPEIENDVATTPAPRTHGASMRILWHDHAVPALLVVALPHVDGCPARPISHRNAHPARSFPRSGSGMRASGSASARSAAQAGGSAPISSVALASHVEPSGIRKPCPLPTSTRI